MASQLLTSIGKFNKPYLGFSKLDHGNYKIVRFSFFKNKNYVPAEPKSVPRILMVELEDQVLFLPEYFSAGLNDDDAKIVELNSDGIVKYLYFGGKRTSGK